MDLPIDARAFLSSSPSQLPTKLPVTTYDKTLPFEELTWEDFERFCYQLGCADMNCLNSAQIYGRPGQCQSGIDIHFLLNKKLSVWQIKHYKSFKAKNLTEIVDKFSNGKWFNTANEFVVCVSCRLDDTRIIDEIDRQFKLLANKGISLSVLDSYKLTVKARAYPELIKTFFGTLWLEALGMAADTPKQRPQFEIKEVSIRQLLKNKIKEFAIPFGLVIFDFLLQAVNNQLIDPPILSIIFLVIKRILWIAIPATTMYILLELVRILLLKKVGKICYYYSKLSLIASVINQFQTPDNSNTCPPNINRVIKNEDNKVFEIIGCTCPYCESNPIGYMRPRQAESYSIKFVCDQNPMHKYSLDPKAKITKV